MTTSTPNPTQNNTTATATATQPPTYAHMDINPAPAPTPYVPPPTSSPSSLPTTPSTTPFYQPTTLPVKPTAPPVNRTFNGVDINDAETPSSTRSNSSEKETSGSWKGKVGKALGLSALVTGIALAATKANDPGDSIEWGLTALILCVALYALYKLGSGTLSAGKSAANWVKDKISPHPNASVTPTAPSINHP